MSNSETQNPHKPALGVEPRPTAPSSRISPPEPVAAPGNAFIVHCQPHVIYALYPFTSRDLALAGANDVVGMITKILGARQHLRDIAVYKGESALDGL